MQFFSPSSAEIFLDKPSLIYNSTDPRIPPIQLIRYMHVNMHNTNILAITLKCLKTIKNQTNLVSCSTLSIIIPVVQISDNNPSETTTLVLVLDISPIYKIRILL